MSSEFKWLTEEVILAIHDRLISEHGGEVGLLNSGHLSAALMRPVNAAAYEKISVFEAAALYAHGITKNHAFEDGNKRTAFMASYIFLAKNGFRLNASEEEATRSVIALTTSELDVPGFAKWLKESSLTQQEYQKQQRQPSKAGETGKEKRVRRPKLTS